MVRVVAGVAWLHSCVDRGGAAAASAAEDPGPDRFVGGDTGLEVLASWDLTVGCETTARLPSVLEVRLAAPGCGGATIGDGLTLRDGEFGRYHLDALNTPGFAALASCVAAEPSLTVWTMLGGGESGCGRGVSVPAGLPMAGEIHLVVDGLRVTQVGAAADVRVELRGRR